MRYRYSLGQTLGSDIITDGTFVAGCGVNWTCGAIWTIAANKASHTTPTFSYLEQDCGFVPGVRYEIKFTVSDIPGGGADFVQVYISGFSVTTNPDNNYYKILNGTYYIYGTCLSADSYIRFGGYGTVSISDVVAKPYEWNSPLTTEPMNWNNTDIAVTESELLAGFYVKFIENLEFSNDGYSYLLGRYTALESVSPKLFCETIPIKIERYVSGAWEEHFTGIIYLNAVKFNLRQKIAIANIEDISTSTVLKHSNNKQFSITYGDTNVYNAASNWDYPAVLCQVKKQSAAADGRYVYFVYNVLRYIVHEVSDLSVTIDSNLLRTTPYDGGANVFQFFGITPFENFAQTVPTYPVLTSFEDIVRDLNKIRDIGGLSTYPNDIPTLRIESKANLRGSTFSFTVDNNKGEFSFYDQNNYQNVEVGFARPNNEDLELFNVGGFVQRTEWTTDKYYSRIRCNENTFDLVSEIGAHPQWIANQLINNEYDSSVTPPVGLQAPFTPRNFWLQMEYSAPNYVSIYANYGGFDWNNPDLEITDIIARHIPTLNSSFYSDVWGAANKTNDPLVRVWEFETPITLAQLNEIIANPNYQIQMTSEYFTGTLTGYILEMEYSNNADAAGKSIATFKIITV